MPNNRFKKNFLIASLGLILSIPYLGYSQDLGYSQVYIQTPEGTYVTESYFLQQVKIDVKNDNQNIDYEELFASVPKDASGKFWYEFA